MKHEYKINSIIPICVGRAHEEVAELNGISDDDIKTNVEKYCNTIWNKQSPKFNISNSNKNIYELKFTNEKAFGDWKIEKEENISPNIKMSTIYAFNSETKERINLTDFELYVIIREYQIAYMNSLNLCIDGTSNPEIFDSPIDYSPYIDAPEDALLEYCH